MSGHHHTNDPNLTQNQGNMLGDRPCVRQSRLYREGCSGNAMKELMGQTELSWKTDQTEGCYGGGRVYDHNTEDNKAVRNGAGYNNGGAPPPPQQQQQRQSYQQDAYQQPPQQQQQQYRQQQQQQYAPPSPQQQQRGGEQQPAVSASTGRGFRPGAGQANRQTYNIFTGQ